MKLPPEIESSGWNFGDHHRRAFSEINENQDAQTAFRNLTSCARPIPHWRLLLSLVSEAESWIGYRMTDKGPVVTGRWDGWEKWNDKWKGLHATAGSLKAIASKMERHIALSKRGPIALPTLIGESEEADDRYTASHMSNQRLDAIVAQLRENAAEIDGFWKLQQDWLRKLPKKKRDDLIQRERLVMFMRSVKQATGEHHYEDIATLLNAVRWSIASCNNVSFETSDELSSDMLRKLSKRFSTPRIERMYPKR